MVNTVTITNVKFKYNIVPSESADGNSNLIKLTDCGKVIFDKCAFEYNAFPNGVVGVEHNTDAMIPEEFTSTDIHLLLKGTTFARNLVMVK